MELTLKAKGRGTLTAGEQGETPYQTGSLCRGSREFMPGKQVVSAGETGSLCRGSANGAAAPYIKSARSAYQERALRISRAAAQVPQSLNVYFFMAT